MEVGAPRSPLHYFAREFSELRPQPFQRRTSLARDQVVLARLSLDHLAFGNEQSVRFQPVQQRIERSETDPVAMSKPLRRPDVAR